MFELYTERARRAILFARYEAGQFRSPSKESEHLLLGLLRVGGMHHALFFPTSGDAESIRAEVERTREAGPEASTAVGLPLSSECKRALELASEEAARLGTGFIGPEHLLLGLLSVEGCTAPRMMLERGADATRIRGRPGNEDGAGQ